MKNRARIIGTMILTFIVTSEVQAQVSRRYPECSLNQDPSHCRRLHRVNGAAQAPGS